MKLLSVIALLGGFTLSHAEPKSENLSLAVTEGGYPPYSYFDENGLETGFYAQLLAQLSNDALNFGYVELPRKRIALNANANDSIFRIANPQWVDSDALISEPFTEYRDVLFTLDKKAKSLRHYDQIKGAKICTNRGFIYSAELTKQFETGALIRIDAPNEESKLLMLERNRCEYMIGEESAIWYIVRKHDFNRPLYQTQILDSIWPMHFIFHPERQDLLSYINSQISTRDFQAQMRQMKIDLAKYSQ